MSELNQILVPGRFEWEVCLIIEGKRRELRGAFNSVGNMTLRSMIDGLRIEVAKTMGIATSSIGLDYYRVEGPF